MTRNAWVLGGVLAMSAALAAAADQSFGTGVKLTTATSIEKLYESPASFVGKTVRVDGVVTAVCEEMGCWMALAAAKDTDRVVRFKVEHDGAIVFPISARGKQASAEGVFMRIVASDAHSTEAAQEHAKAQPTASTFGKTYQIVVTGAVVR